MKLVRQVRLRYSPPASERGGGIRVVEVDLCELTAERWVVNVRQGPLGGVLQENSRTPLPVVPEEAERTFDRVVQEYRDRGFVDDDGLDDVVEPPDGSTEPAATAAPPTPPPPVDPRRERLAYLLGRPHEAWTTNLDRLIFRVGELRVPGVTEILVGMLDGADDKRAWNVARALMRCGDAQAAPALRALYDSEAAGHARSMAAHAFLTVAELPEAEAFRAEIRSQIPPDLYEALLEARHEPLQADLEDAPEQLEHLYLSAEEGVERVALVDFLSAMRVRPPLWRSIRRLYKVAEAKNDALLHGMLVHRIQTSRASYVGRNARRAYLRGRDPRVGFSDTTRMYFVRRGWRTLRRLADVGMAEDYTSLAAGILLAVNDDDARAFRRIPYYDYMKRRQSAIFTPRFGHLWAFNNILYGSSPDHSPDLRSRMYRLRPGIRPDEVRPTSRVEAFAELWDQTPHLFVTLVRRSRCREVHGFAARGLRDHPAQWPRFTRREVLDLMRSDYASTAELAADIAVTRYDAGNPDLELVQALISCPYAGPRGAALQWVRDQPAAFLGRTSFAAMMVLNPQEPTRRTALDLLSSVRIPEAYAQEVVDLVLGQLLVDDDALRPASDVIQGATGVLLAAFGPTVRSLPLDRVQQLIQHPDADVAELGAKVLLGHERRAPELPDELLALLLRSPVPMVRRIGVMLYGELSDDVLIERFLFLRNLVTSRHAELRESVTPLIARLASHNPDFGLRMVEALVPAIALEAEAGVIADTLRLFEGALSDSVARLSTDKVLVLVRAADPEVQALGGRLIRTMVDTTALTTQQACELANSDLAAIREAGWRLLESKTEELRRDVDTLLTVLDAEWEDTRQVGFRLVEERIGADTLSANLVIAICDSVHPDVQAFGRRMVTQMFGSDQGPLFLLKLSQHPAPDMQLFASAWLDVHAAGQPEQLERLVPFLVSVMTRPNRGRVAKTRVMAYLEAEAQRSARSARVIIELLEGFAASSSIQWRAKAIALLNEIRRAWPELETPLKVRRPELRSEAIDVV